MSQVYNLFITIFLRSKLDLTINYRWLFRCWQINPDNAVMLFFCLYVCLYHSGRVFQTDLYAVRIEPLPTQHPLWFPQKTDSAPGESETSMFTDLAFFISPVKALFPRLHSIDIDHLSVPWVSAVLHSGSLLWRWLLQNEQDNRQNLSPAHCAGVSMPNKQRNTFEMNARNISFHSLINFWLFCFLKVSFLY